MDAETHASRIKPLTFSDLQEAVVLHTLCFDQPWHFDSFQTLMFNPCVQSWIYREKNGMLAGIIMGQFIPPEAEIYTLATHPVYRRQKIATLLLETFLQNCQQNHLKKVMLEVGVNNLSALDLYRRHNFQTTGRRKKYYCDKKGFYTDAYLLEIDINI